MKCARSKSLIVLAALGLGVSTVLASTAPDLAAARKALRSLPAIELPAQAAQLVAQVKPEDREVVAATVITAALDVRPTSTLSVVGAIARQSPEAAAAVAVKAAALQPKSLAEIAAAAAAAAPEQAGKIVEALCKAKPASYAVIASSVGKAVPTAAKQIVAAVKTAIPSVKPFVDRATNDLAQDATVAAIMLRAQMLQASDPATARALASASPAPLGPPTVGDPFVPSGDEGGPSVIYTPGSTRTVPEGGDRDYSTP